MTSISHVVLVSWKSGKHIQDRGSRPAVCSRLPRHNPRRARRGRGALHEPEGLEDGYHYGFIVAFATLQARDAYLNDPNHRPVAEAIDAAAERIVVFDI